MPDVIVKSQFPVIVDTSEHTGATEDVNINITNTGTKHVYVATGSVGQTATVSGSLDGVIWVEIVSFEIEETDVPLSVALDHVWPLQKITGNATVQIAKAL